MEYLLTFLEGLVSFISPCILPVIPIFLGYLVGGISTSDIDKKELLIQVLYFIFGFTIIFVALGATSGFLGSILVSHLPLVRKIGGIIIIIFGLSYLGVLALPLFKGEAAREVKIKGMHWYKSLLFGMVFSVGFSPCTGPFLASALVKATSSGNIYTGMILLALYSLGLGIPFILSALLLDQLKTLFDGIKKHYKIITLISGLLLIIVGLLMVFK